MNINFSGKTVLVSGGTGGLGNAVSLAFLEEGARVVVTYRKEEEYAALKTAAGAKAAALEGSLVDVTDERATTELVAGVVARHGRLDASVNTVGGYAGGVTLWELETKVFDTMLSLNLRSGYALARAVLPAMLKQRAWINCERGGKGGVRSWSRGSGVCCVESRCGSIDGFAGCGREGHRGEGELDPSEHHRYGRKPEGDAEC